MTSKEYFEINWPLVNYVLVRKFLIDYEIKLPACIAPWFTVWIQNEKLYSTLTQLVYKRSKRNEMSTNKISNPRFMMEGHYLFITIIFFQAWLQLVQTKLLMYVTQKVWIWNTSMIKLHFFDTLVLPRNRSMTYDFIIYKWCTHNSFITRGQAK